MRVKHFIFSSCATRYAYAVLINGWLTFRKHNSRIITVALLVLASGCDENDLEHYATQGMYDSGVFRWCLPVIIMAVFLETILLGFSSHGRINKTDSIVNIAFGFGVAGSVLLIKGTQWFIYYGAWCKAFFDIPVTVYSWILCFFACDFIFYWFHRLGHEVNVFWASHQTHHSSKQFNLSVGVRNNIIHVFYRFLFWTPLCLIGFHPVMIITCDTVSTVYQFFLHTKRVRKLSFLEYFFCTPSNHRVHHGCNEIYLDKNYSGCFIIWDRMFGTYQEETEDVKYGLTGGEESYSILKLAFGYWVSMIGKARKRGNFFIILFGRPTHES